MRSGVLVMGLVVCGAAHGVMRRHDVPDADYINAANGFPIAWIQYAGDTSFTVSGVLIRDRYILSAAHCVRPGTHTAIIGGQAYSISNWVAHPTWNFSAPDYFNHVDLSVARIGQRVTAFAPLEPRATFPNASSLFTAATAGGTGIGNGPNYVFPWAPIPSSWPNRSMTNRVDVDTTLPNVFFADFDSPAGDSNALSFLGSTAVATAREGNLIFGDSGGPALFTAGTTTTIIGICSSLGDQNQNGILGDYGDWSLFARVPTQASWILSTAWEPGRVDGRVALGSIIGSPSLRSVVVEIRNLNGSSALETATVPLAVNGGFSFVTSRRGAFDLRFRVPGFVARTVRNVTISNTGPGGLLVSLPNGDVDQSGEVDAADIDVVIANFGAQTTSATLGDTDISGEVDAADIDVVIANFGANDN